MLNSRLNFNILLFQSRVKIREVKLKLRVMALQDVNHRSLI